MLRLGEFKCVRDYSEQGVMDTTNYKHYITFHIERQKWLID